MGKKRSAEPRVGRTPAELREAFKQQVKLLTTYCRLYDEGDHSLALPTSTCLRLLIHQSGKSRSLLDQLGLRGGRFYTTAPPLNPRNLMTECNLVVLRMSLAGAEFLPAIGPLAFRDRLAFPEWWLAPVLKGKGGVTMSRHDVVTAVANTDGGAHVDPGLEAIYHSFRSGALLNWFHLREPAPRHGAEAGGPPLSPGGTLIREPQYACIRAIAHEFLLTMQKYAPWAFGQKYEPISVLDTSPMTRREALR
jgi:hypothetical protein